MLTVEFADDHIFILKELVERADGYAGAGGDFLAGERFEADVDEQLACRGKDRVELELAALLSRTSSRDQNLCRHAFRLPSRVAPRSDKRRDHVADSVESGAERLPVDVSVVDSLEAEREFEECEAKMESDVTDVPSSGARIALKDFITRQVTRCASCILSLIHISEPTRRTPISYA